jgi:hypothetical protein
LASVNCGFFFGDLKVERDCAFLRFLPGQMDVLLASEVRVRDGLNGLLETLSIILVGSRFGLILAICVFALRIRLRQLRVASGDDFGNEGDVLELLVSHCAE